MEEILQGIAQSLQDIHRLLMIKPTIYEDETVFISTTKPWILDYKGYHYVYVFSSSTFRLVAEDLGGIHVIANVWTPVNLQEGLKLTVANNSYTFLARATNDFYNVGNTGSGKPNHAISANSTNDTNVKTSPGRVYGLSISNVNASARFFKLYDKASTPVVGTDTPKTTIQVPGNSTVMRAYPIGLSFTAGIGFGATGAMADSDVTAISAGDLSMDMDYQ